MSMPVNSNQNGAMPLGWNKQEMKQQKSGWWGRRKDGQPYRKTGRIGMNVLKGGLSAGRMGISGARSFNQYRAQQKQIGDARQQFYFVWQQMKQIDPNTPSWEEYRKNIREWIGKAGKQNIPTILQSERQKISMMQSQPMQMQPQPMIYQPMQIQQNKTLPMQIQQNKTLPMQIQQNQSMPMRSPV
jgi:hypothetical protein